MCLAATLTFKKNFSCFSKSARHGLHIGWSENMAAVVRLLPSIRPQMASLTPALLIFQHALCGHHLEKSCREKLVKRKGAFRRKGQGEAGWLKSLKNILLTIGFQTHHLEKWAVDAVQVHTSSEWVSSLVNIMCLKFLTRSPLPYPSLVNAVLPLHTPLHIFTCLSFLSPPSTHHLPSVCRGQTQIYNNCQSQGWQIN